VEFRLCGDRKEGRVLGPREERKWGRKRDGLKGGRVGGGKGGEGRWVGVEGHGERGEGEEWRDITCPAD